MEAIEERWTVTDDKSAEWVLKKIKESEAERDRLVALADEQMAEIKTLKEEAIQRCESENRYRMALLAEYFTKVEHKKTKTTETYKLLHGTLTLKKGQPTYKRDDAALVEYLKANRPELVKVTESPNWAEFKKVVEIAGDAVIDSETGEVVAGVTVEIEPDSFVIK